MPNYEATITNFAAGDDLSIERTITTVPSGQTMSTAWLTVKRSVSDTDVQAVFQKEITSALVAGEGQIDDTGADGTAHLIFYLAAADTVLLTPLSDYRYDIQVKLSGGGISTPEIGVITAFPQMTRAT
jgi:hypothetical protein